MFVLFLVSLLHWTCVFIYRMCQQIVRVLLERTGNELGIYSVGIFKDILKHRPFILKKSKHMDLYDQSIVMF